MSERAAGRTRRKPFTLRERKRWSQDFGSRYTSDWCSGSLPAPFCAGDVVELVGTVPDSRDGYNRLRGQEGPFFVVTYGPSIDDGDAWYFRVYDGNGETGSDRMHVAYADRCSDHWTEDVNWMEPFRLVETVDPEGLALRERMLAVGWSLRSAPCSSCGGSGVQFAQPESGRVLYEGEGA